MEHIFKSVLLLSLAGSVLSAVLLLLKPVTKRVFGSRWQYYIWLCVLVVMILPVSFELPVKQESNRAVPQGGQTVQDRERAGAEATMGEPPAAAHEQAPLEHRNRNLIKEIPQSLPDHVGYIWLLGAGLFLCGGLISYWRFLRMIHQNSRAVSCPQLETLKEKKGIKRTICVRVTGLLSAPLMAGIFKPTLLLPDAQMGDRELHYILLHELTHLKRRDLWYKWFAMLVNAVHWFNPLIYFVAGQINEECEISCDLSVTKDMSEEEKNGYMSTIVSLLSAKKENNNMLTTAMANDTKQIKRRFMMIRKATKKSKIISLVSVAAALLMLTVTVFASGVLKNEMQGANTVHTEMTAFGVDEPAKNRTNVLITGVDASQMRADTFMVVSFSHTDKSLAVLSIPRDTLITDDNGNQKISALMGGVSGDQHVIDAVRNILGIPVNYYARLNFEGLRTIVDILGGVEFDVPVPMQYDDPAQNLHILLDKGLQVLDGAKAESLLRYRSGYSEGDLSRIKVQQNFVTEFLRQKLQPQYLAKTSQLYHALSENLITNYPPTEFAEDIKTVKEINFDGVKTFTLPGQAETRNGMFYYAVNPGELQNLTETYFIVK